MLPQILPILDTMNLKNHSYFYNFVLSKLDIFSLSRVQILNSKKVDDGVGATL